MKTYCDWENRQFGKIHCENGEQPGYLMLFDSSIEAIPTWYIIQDEGTLEGEDMDTGRRGYILGLVVVKKVKYGI